MWSTPSSAGPRTCFEPNADAVTVYDRPRPHYLGLYEDLKGRFALLAQGA